MSKWSQLPLLRQHAALAFRAACFSKQSTVLKGYSEYPLREGPSQSARLPGLPIGGAWPICLWPRSLSSLCTLAAPTATIPLPPAGRQAGAGDGRETRCCRVAGQRRRLAVCPALLQAAQKGGHRGSVVGWVELEVRCREWNEIEWGESGRWGEVPMVLAIASSTIQCKWLHNI